jgi:COP9 signalosome complex subunit 2
VWPEEEEEEPELPLATEIENLMYTGDQWVESKPEQALSSFEEVIKLEKDNKLNEKTFICLKWIIILSGKLGDFEKSKGILEQLLSMTDTWGRNEVNEAITHIIKFANELSETEQKMEILNKVMGSLKSSNKTLWLTSCIDMGEHLISNAEYK